MYWYYLGGSGGGGVSLDAEAPLVVSGNISVDGIADCVASTNISGSGSISVSAVLITRPSANLPGSANITADTIAIINAGTSLLGSGSILVNTSAQINGEADFEPSGALNPSGYSNLVGVTNLTGSGSLLINTSALINGGTSLSSSGNINVDADSNLVGTTNLTGSGNLLVNTSALIYVDSSVAGSASLSVDADVYGSGTINLIGSGSLLVNTSALIRGDSDLTASSTLNVQDIAIINATSSISGTATLSPTATLYAFESSSLNSSSVLNVSTTTILFNGTNLNAVGNLNVAGFASDYSGATFAGTGTLNVNNIAFFGGNAAIAGSGTLQSDSVALIHASCNLSGSAALSVTTSTILVDSFDGSSSATIAPSAQLLVYNSSNLSTSAEIEAESVVGILAEIDIDAECSVNFSAQVRKSFAADVQSSAILNVSAIAARNGVENFTVNASISCSALLGRLGHVNLIASAIFEPILVTILNVRATLTAEADHVIPIGGSIRLYESPLNRFTSSYSVNVIMPFEWHILKNAEKEFSFKWGLGKSVLYWYQVNGKCLVPDCDNVGFDPNDSQCSDGMSYVQYVAATDLNDLCAKLSSKTITNPWKWPILSVKRYSKPVYLSDQRRDEAAGIDHSCQKLEEVPIGSFASCVEFSTDLLIEKIKVTDFINTVFYTYEFDTEYPITVSGDFEVVDFENPEFEGGIEISSDFSFSASYYTSTFGSTSPDMIVSSDFGVQSSAWSGEFSGDIIIEGDFTESSSQYNHTFSGEMTLASDDWVTDAILTGSFSGYFTMESDFGFTVEVQPDFIGGAEMSGDFTAISSYYVGDFSGGGVMASDFSVTSPFWQYEFEDGVVVDGDFGIGFHLEFSGSVSLTGDFEFEIDNNDEFDDTPIVVASGFVTVESSGYTGDFSGGAVMASDFDSSWSNLGTIEGFMKATDSIVEIEARYPIFVDSAETLIKLDDDVRIGCGCDFMPVKLSLSHNLSNSEILNGFLAKSNNVLPKNIVLIYDKKNKSWRRNYHFKSKSGEVWNILAEWTCFNDILDSSSNNNLWRFSLLFDRRLNNKKTETRVLYTFPLDKSCFNGKINLGFSVNTNNNAVTVDFPNKNIYVKDQVFTDQLGIFGGKLWFKNPLFKVKLFESSESSGFSEINVSSRIPRPSFAQ